MKSWPLLLLTVRALAADSPVPDCRNITIHVQDSRIPGTVNLEHAEKEAGQILATAGVQIKWTQTIPDELPGDCGPPIVVRFTIGQQIASCPRALAYSTPYDKQRSWITVFWDKLTHVSARTLCLRADLLAHVLAHEAAHSLQRNDYHSGTGLMRDSWTNQDYYQMLRGSLRFTAVDIQLVLAGIESRARRTTRCAIATDTAADCFSPTAIRADRPAN